LSWYNPKSRKGCQVDKKLTMISIDHHVTDLKHLDSIAESVDSELKSAIRKFPLFPNDIIHAVSIMNEESGESIKAALQLVYEDGAVEDLEKELIQTAAMCFRVLLALENEFTKP